MSALRKRPRLLRTLAFILTGWLGVQVLPACGRRPAPRPARPKAARPASPAPQPSAPPKSADRAGSEPAQTGDAMVILWHEGLGRYSLAHVTVPPGGTAVTHTKIPLSERYHYSGPVATSPETCLLLGDRGAPQELEYAALQWRLGSQDVTEMASPSRAFYADWGVELSSYSRLSGDALLYPNAPEGFADPVVTWIPGTDHWEELADAYPHLKGVATQITAASYSPDGSLLAVAARQKILAYDLRKRRWKAYAGPKQYVWSLCISPGNSEVCWLDCGRARAMSEWIEHGEETVTLDRYDGAGFGIVCLRTGRSRYRRLSQEAGLPAEFTGWVGQPDSKCAFSPDGKSLYFLSSGLIRLDRASGRWSTVAGMAGELGPYLSGFAIMPRAEQDDGMPGTGDASRTPSP
jgi:hypothetical protein